jgi:hypothetical protein
VGDGAVEITVAILELGEEGVVSYGCQHIAIQPGLTRYSPLGFMGTGQCMR